MSKLILLFDGDIVAYRAGFAAEKRVYFDRRTPPAAGGSSFSSKKEALDNVEAEFIEWERELEPLENALFNCKSLIDNAGQYCMDYFNVDSLSYVTFLTGNKTTPNFRTQVAEDYKANRDPEHKPTYLNDIQQYLIREHNAFLSEGCEADDFFGQASLDAIKQDATPVIASIDKDLKQIPGYHYNFVTGTIEQVSQERADAVFFRQMLEGDRVDNVTGIKGIGPAKAIKLIPEGIPDKEAVDIIVNKYKKEFKDEWKNQYNKNCDLLWIWRKVPDACPFKV